MHKQFTPHLGQKTTDELLTIADPHRAIRPLTHPRRMGNYYRYSVIDGVGAGTQGAAQHHRSPRP